MLTRFVQILRYTLYTGNFTQLGQIAHTVPFRIEDSNGMKNWSFCKPHFFHKHNKLTLFTILLKNKYFPRYFKDVYITNIQMFRH